MNINKMRTGKIMLLSALIVSVSGIVYAAERDVQRKTMRSARTDSTAKGRVRTGTGDKVRTTAQGIITQSPVGRAVVNQSSFNPNANVAMILRDDSNAGAIRHKKSVDGVRRGDGYYDSGYSNYGVFIPEVASTVIFSDDDASLTLQEALNRIALLRRENYTLREEISSFREQLGR